MCNKVWRREKWIKEWEEEIIVPIKKKGEEKKVEDYKKITLILYKVYTMIIGERLEKEMEGRKIVPQNQAGFRRTMGTMDNVYEYMNYLVNRQLSRDSGKLIALFIDLKTAFDSVDREMLVKS